MYQIDINGVKITLTKEQLKEIEKQTKDSREIYKKVNDLNTLINHLGYNPLVYPSPSNKFEKYINACSVLAKVAEVYNEGVILDWKNVNIYKYLPYKYYSGGSCSVAASFVVWSFTPHASAFLYYKSEKLSKESYNNFKEYWKDFWGN